MFEERSYAVYILASKPYGTLYMCVTGNLVSRITQHCEDVFEGFTKRYGVHRLVWYDEFGDLHRAIQREKTMKNWPRQWKINLIEQQNPYWIDLYPSFCAAPKHHSDGLHHPSPASFFKIIVDNDSAPSLHLTERAAKTVNQSHSSAYGEPL